MVFLFPSKQAELYYLQLNYLLTLCWDSVIDATHPLVCHPKPCKLKSTVTLNFGHPNEIAAGRSKLWFSAPSSFEMEFALIYSS